MKAISYKDDELKMPPSKKLAAEQIDALTQWVKMGAPWPGADKEPVIVARVRCRSPTRTAALGLSAAQACPRALGEGSRPGSPIRSTPSCWLGWKRRDSAESPGVETGTAAPRLLRSDRTAADAAGG